MVRERICGRRSEAVDVQRRMRYLRTRLMRARKSTTPTLGRSDWEMTPVSTRAALAEPHSAITEERARVQRRKAARLRRSQSIADARPDENSLRNRELRWLIAHRREYPGLWLALDGSVLVASSASLIEALDQARQKGSTNPLLAWSEDVAEMPFGGW